MAWRIGLKWSNLSFFFLSPSLSLDLFLSLCLPAVSISLPACLPPFFFVHPNISLINCERTMLTFSNWWSMRKLMTKKTARNHMMIKMMRQQILGRKAKVTIVFRICNVKHGMYQVMRKVFNSHTMPANLKETVMWTTPLHFAWGLQKVTVKLGPWSGPDFMGKTIGQVKSLVQLVHDLEIDNNYWYNQLWLVMLTSC